MRITIYHTNPTDKNADSRGDHYGHVFEVRALF